MERLLHCSKQGDRAMMSRVELEINARHEPVAEAFAEPRNNPAWMDDIDRIEPLSGELGQPGSTYRIVPKRGNGIFVASVEKRALPVELKLSLDSPRVSVLIRDTFQRINDTQTKLISEEIFTFKGLFGRLAGLFGRRAIKRAHRRHMESFKRFAERTIIGPRVPAVR
jgi:hypothetical protein